MISSGLKLLRRFFSLRHYSQESLIFAKLWLKRSIFIFSGFLNVQQYYRNHIEIKFNISQSSKVQINITNTLKFIDNKLIINDNIIALLKFTQDSMINFILKPQLLPISKTTNVHHFYEFQAKQIKQKQIEEKKKLDNFLAKIKEEQQTQKQPKNEVSKLNPSLDEKDKDFSKTYILNTSMKTQSKARPTSTKSYDEFYQKNKRWRQNVEAQTLKRKQYKLQQEQKELSQCRKPLSEKQSTQNNKTLQNPSLHHAFQSKGPISGWTQRFHDYIKKRLPQDPEQDFKPKINKKSQIIAGRMVGKVEDRLIKFGEIMKIRKHEMVIEEIQKIGKLPTSEQHYLSTNSNKSDFFYRLYKEGQNTNRKTMEKNQRIIKSQFSFKPAITKLPENMEKKVQQKREKSPLYSSNKISKQESQRLLQLYKKETGKAYSESNFENFLKRNELLLRRKEKNMQLKLKQDISKAQKEMKQCTFIPLLNPKSIRLFQKMQQKIVQEQNEQDHQQYDAPLQESYSQLFGDYSKSGEAKNREKYNYNHSYTQQNEFEYGIRTPIGEKWEIQNEFYMNTQSKSKPHEVSELDSLEFSGYKNDAQSQIKLHNFSQNQESGNFPSNHDEMIDYELTFSNKKLSKQLKFYNEEVQINEKQSLIQQPKQDNTSQFVKTQSAWQDELEKVKSRLQNLMKSNTKIQGIK